MGPAGFEVVEASAEAYRPVLRHLFELYVYDFSEYTGASPASTTEATSA